MKKLLLFISLSLAARGAEKPLFESDVLPILHKRCFECHSHASKIKGGLALDSRSGWEEGGDNGPAIRPGQLETSLLIKAIRYVDSEFEMPPKGKLPASEIAILEEWVKSGAHDPRITIIAKEKKGIDLAAGRQFWAFQPVTSPTPPKVKNTPWSLDPLDRFVLAKQEPKGIRPTSDAPPHLWLRRVSLDLTGLPPTPQDIAAFDPADYEAAVDRLLSSKAYGERWARHWLDLTGYADMMGTSNSVYAEHAWRYRDYLISAFNADKPFDEFIREQIAGDLMPSKSTEDRAENLTATGFLMVGDIEIVNPDKAKMETDHIDTQVIKIGQAFLGMTIGCARCHDHKFDPIGLEDYYGIAGTLRSSPSSHKMPDMGVWSTLNSTVLPETPARLSARKKLEAADEQRIVSLKAEQKKMADEKAALDPANTQRRDELDDLLKKLAGDLNHAEFFKDKTPRAFAMSDGPSPADMPIYVRGNPYAPAAIVPRGTLRVASWDKFPAIPAGQSGRLQLADWLADKRNPLTARVVVNRLWQKLFGTGLVPSVDYFGTRGDAPTHPELLDHLATRFMQGGWSQKAFLRSLVLSRTYRLSSANDAAAMKLDPENKLFWRMNRQRLDAEALRDSLLAVSGELIRDGGGPALVLEHPENCGSLSLKGVNPPSYNHRNPRPTQEFVRTLYLPVLRNGLTAADKLRADFDFVDPAMITGQRNQTIVPTQTLFLLNSDLIRRRATALAKDLSSEPKDLARLTALWLRVLNRPITSAEREEALSFLSRVKSSNWLELCHSLLASNEFVFRF